MILPYQRQNFHVIQIVGEGQSVEVWVAFQVALCGSPSRGQPGNNKSIAYVILYMRTGWSNSEIYNL